MSDLFQIDLGSYPLWVATRPRGGDWAERDLMVYRQRGVRLLVSMLTNEEETELDLVNEAAAASATGLAFMRLPLSDRGTPPSVDEWLDALRTPFLAWSGGVGTAAHCRMGIGRSSLLVASIMVAANTPPDVAWEQIANARKRPVPDTPEQRDFIRSLWERLEARASWPFDGQLPNTLPTAETPPPFQEGGLDTILLCGCCGLQHAQSRRVPSRGSAERSHCPFCWHEVAVNGEHLTDADERIALGVIARTRRGTFDDSVKSPPHSNAPPTPQDLIGRVVLVGETLLGQGGSVVEQRQYYGRVFRVDRAVHLSLLGSKNRAVKLLPPHLPAYEPAARGEYRLRSTGEVVVDPDYTTSWTIGQNQSH